MAVRGFRRSTGESYTGARLSMGEHSTETGQGGAPTTLSFPKYFSCSSDSPLTNHILRPGRQPINDQSCREWAGLLTPKISPHSWTSCGKCKSAFCIITIIRVLGILVKVLCILSPSVHFRQEPRKIVCYTSWVQYTVQCTRSY